MVFSGLALAIHGYVPDGQEPDLSTLVTSLNGNPPRLPQTRLPLSWPITTGWIGRIDLQSL